MPTALKTGKENNCLLYILTYRVKLVTVDIFSVFLLVKLEALAREENEADVFFSLLRVFLVHQESGWHQDLSRQILTTHKRR